MEGKGRVLVIDDDCECLELARAVLSREGLEVCTATDGEEGQRKALALRPDLIVLDVLMPEADGWDTCDALRSLPELKGVPIVFLSCVEPPKSVFVPHGALDTVWDEYLTKPLRPKELIAAVRKHLGRPTSPRR